MRFRDRIIIIQIRNGILETREKTVMDTSLKSSSELIESFKYGEAVMNTDKKHDNDTIKLCGKILSLGKCYEGIILSQKLEEISDKTKEIAINMYDGNIFEFVFKK